MKNRYQKAFDAVSPIWSDEELLRAVLDRKAENMKITRKIGKKAIAILVAAAVVLGVTAVGVGAAYQWNLSAAFEGLFRNRSETFGEKEDPGIDFSRIGTEIGESWHGEGYTLTIDGAIADEGTAYFYYTLAFDEDFPYDHAPQMTDGTEQGSWLVDERTLNLESNGELLNYKIERAASKDDVRWIDENTMQGAFWVTTSENRECLTNRELTLGIRTISRFGFDENEGWGWKEEVDCGLTAELFFDHESVYKPVTVTPELPLEDGTLTELTVSMFSVDYTILGKTNSFWEVSLCNFCRVTLRDGTDVKTSGGSAEGFGKKGSVHTNFLYPIDPAEVASVRIGDTVIDLTDR